MPTPETVAVIVFNPAGEVLIVDHPKFVVTFPGGHVEDGETLEEAAIRELAEETGLACEPAALVALAVTGSDGAPTCAWYTTVTTERPADPERINPRFAPVADVPFTFPDDAARCQLAWARLHEATR